jgi:hypothetical protein
LLGNIGFGFDITDKLFTRFSAFVGYWKKACKYIQTVHQLFTGFQKAYDSVRKEV